MRSFQLNDLELTNTNDFDFKTSLVPPSGFISLSGSLGSPLPDTSAQPLKSNPHHRSNDHSYGNDLESGVPSGTFTQSSSSGGFWFWNLEAYRSYFNVTTNEVKQRLKLALLASTKSSSTSPSSENLHYHNDLSHQQQTPSFWDTFHQSSSGIDLYGPLWICITLLLVFSISGNFSSRMSHHQALQTKLQQLSLQSSSPHIGTLLTSSSKHSFYNNSISTPNRLLEGISEQEEALNDIAQQSNEDDSLITENDTSNFAKPSEILLDKMISDEPWVAEFQLVSSGTLVLSLSFFIASCIIYIGLTSIGSKYRFLQIVSLVGYSFTPYIICGILACFPLRIVQWLLLLFAGVIASRFIVNNLKSEVFQLTTNMSMSRMDPSSLMHAAMFVVLLIYLCISSILKITFL